MKKYLSILFLVIGAFAAKAQTIDKVEALAQRVDELEKNQAEQFVSDDRSSKVNAFLKDNLTFGGFFEPSMTTLHGSDTRLQSTNSANLLGLNLAAEFNQSLRFVSQYLVGLTFPLQNQHNDPRAAQLSLPPTREFGPPFFGAIISQGYISYTLDDHYTLMGGMGYVPFGFYPQQRELVLFIRRGGPQLLRTQNLFSPLFNGINLQSHFDRGSSVYGFNIYSFNRLEDAKRPGVGARSWWGTSEDTIRTGLSYQTAKFNAHMENIFGADLRLTLRKFILTTEYARHYTDSGEDPWAFYVEPSIFVYSEDVLFYLFYDHSNNVDNQTGSGSTAINDPVKKTEYGGGINWLPTSFTRLRAGFTYYDYRKESDLISGQKRDYYGLDLSIGVAF